MGSVRLTVVPAEMEADLVCGMLRAEGIECFHRVTDLAAHTTFRADGWREVFVDEADVARARELLEAVETVVDRCSRCGREIAGDSFWYRDETGELAPYCAICAERLFGSF